MNKKANQMATNQTQAGGCLKPHFLRVMFFLAFSDKWDSCVSLIHGFQSRSTLHERVPGRWRFRRCSALPGFTQKKLVDFCVTLSLYVGKHISPTHREVLPRQWKTDVLAGLGIAQSKCKCHWKCRWDGTRHCTCGCVRLRSALWDGETRSVDKLRIWVPPSRTQL